eukprot:357548-Chlamydomonas_euryale.AAC.1
MEPGCKGRRWNQAARGVDGTRLQGVSMEPGVGRDENEPKMGGCRAALRKWDRRRCPARGVRRC